jgi:hypothetical protein
MQFCYLMSLSLLVLFAAYSTSLIKAAYLWALILPMIYYFLLGFVVKLRALNALTIRA